MIRAARAFRSLMTSVNFNWTLLAILLLAAVLRWAALPSMSRFLMYDEAYDGIDALALLQHFTLTPFSPVTLDVRAVGCTC